MPFSIVRQDITRMEVDAVVNAANRELRQGGGVCGAIFQAAGVDALTAACDALAPIKTGEAVITHGFALKAKYIIHTAGPVYDSKNEASCEELLRKSYINSLRLALENDCESVAFPLISSGIYGYPKDKALSVAVDAIRDFLDENETDVYLTVFDRESFILSDGLLGEIKSYIDGNYVEKHYVNRMSVEINDLMSAPHAYFTPRAPKKAIKTDEKLKIELDEPFSAVLLRLIDEKGKKDAEVYKRANIDRKLFSKIRSGNGYMPGKRTILALAIALELTLDETNDLLLRAGYALSHSRLFDVIVEYFIVNGKYDIYEINEVLFSYDQPLLGA